MKPTIEEIRMKRTIKDSQSTMSAFRRRKIVLDKGVRPALLAVMAVGGLLFAATPAPADVIGPSPSYCLRPALGNKKPNCTANDTRLAGVKLDANGDPIVTPDECTKNADFLLTATFLVATNASIRYDLAVGFSADGDPNGDGARTGSCTRSTVPSTGAVPTAQDLDGDACGDVTSAISPVDLVVTDLQVKCVDTDGDGFVNLPYYVSWAQNDTVVCDDATEALPGTVSKCELNDTFNIPVRIAQPLGGLSKTATVVVRYDIVVNNTGETELTLQELVDSVYGDILDSTNTDILDTDCVDDTTIAAPVPPATENSYSCHFRVQFDGTTPGSATPVENTVTASGVDENTTPWGGAASTFEDDAKVTVFVE